MEQTLPTDLFSRRRRELSDNPGALGSGSRVPTQDFLGNFQDWIVETFRVDGAETVFITVADQDGGRRLMLPPQVTATLYRQRDQLVARQRRKTARATVAMRRERGDKLGNPDALRKARKRNVGRGKK
jgi:hypothetical protein